METGIQVNNQNGNLYLTLKFLDTKNWWIAVWAACVKKNIFFSIFSFGQVNYIFHKLFENIKHAQFRLHMSPW
jgi:hypothetical protein